MAESNSHVSPITSDDFDTIRGAMITFVTGGKPVLAQGQKLLWDILLKAAQTDEKKVSESQLELHADNEKWPGLVFRKLQPSLNKKLTALLGYGYFVRVKKDSDNNYFLEIKKYQPTLDLRKRFNHKFGYVGKLKNEDPQTKEIEVWVPVHNNGGEIDIKFRSDNKLWTPPKKSVQYDEFRNARWEIFSKKHNKRANSYAWCVESFLPVSDDGGKPTIELKIKPVAYEDIVATTLNLAKEIIMPTGRATVEDWLKNFPPRSSHWGLTHFLPAANPLSVDVNVITKDDFYIFRRYQEPHPILLQEKKRITRWVPGLDGYVDKTLDVYRNNLLVPDPSETVFRKAYELLNIAILPARIKWLGVGFGLKFGGVSLFGEIKINYTKLELEKMFDTYENPKPNAEFSKLFGPNYLRFVKCGFEEVHNFLNEKNAEFTEHRPHFEVLLALSLAEASEVRVETETTPTDELLTEIKTYMKLTNETIN